MIQSASSSPNAGQSAALGGGPAATGPRTPPARPDDFTSGNTAALRASLQQAPALRPEVVARARALAADPNYPTDAIIRHVGALILASPDLSEEGS